MRVVKKAEERKNEILDAAEVLFSAKGYDRATINDILNVVGIAKGTFYHHFKSKEEVLDGIVTRRSETGVTAAARIADAELGAREKLLYIMLSRKPARGTEDAHAAKAPREAGNAENARMHVKSAGDFVSRLTPILSRVTEQGVAEGVFSTPYPAESAEILLAATYAVLDMASERAETEGLAVAFVSAAERLLGTEPGALSPLRRLFAR